MSTKSALFLSAILGAFYAVSFITLFGNAGIAMTLFAVILTSFVLGQYEEKRK